MYNIYILVYKLDQVGCVRSGYLDVRPGNSQWCVSCLGSPQNGDVFSTHYVTYDTTIHGEWAVSNCLQLCNCWTFAETG